MDQKAAAEDLLKNHTGMDGPGMMPMAGADMMSMGGSNMMPMGGQ